MFHETGVPTSACWLLERGSVTPALANDHDEVSDTGKLGSPYVPLDSWIYPALERLAALGYIDTAVMGLRPWTRLECARLVSEASDRQVDTGDSQVANFLESLSRDFAYWSHFGMFATGFGVLRIYLSCEPRRRRMVGISATIQT